MKTGWSIVTAFAAVSIGFGAGSWQSYRTDREGSEGDGKVEAVTFLGRARTTEGAASATTGLSFSTFAEAKPQLELLVSAYQGLTIYQPHVNPVEGERMLQEIERILALADETQLVDFIKRIEPSGNAESLFEIFFGALARRSPTEAIQTGLEVWPKDLEDYPGLHAVLREWEQRDSAAAERWIESLSEGSLKTAAHVTFLTVKAGTNPALAVARLEEIDPKKGSGFAAILGNTLDLAACPEIAEKILAMRPQQGSPAEMLAAFLSSWGDRDPDPMMDWLLSQDLESLGSDLVRQALLPLASADPKGFLEKLTPSLSKQPALRESAGQAWWGWIAMDGGETGAIEWLGENVASASDFLQGFVASVYSRSVDWSPQRTERILATLGTLPQNDEFNSFSHGFLAILSNHQPKLVLDYAMDRLPLGSRTDQTIAGAVGHWAKSDPESAIRWSLENLESPGSKSTAVRFAISSWGEKDPHAAAAMVLTLPEKERGNAFWSLGLQWAEQDPEGVISFLKNSPDPTVISSLTENSFRRFSEVHQGGDYVGEALAMPPGKMRHDAVRGLFSGWALSDTTGGVAAMEKIPEGTLRDAAIQGFNGFAIRSDPKLAIDLATKISVPATRERELLNRARSWLKEDRASAEASIRANPAIPETVKAELFK
jgi:hypothetical protein